MAQKVEAEPRVASTPPAPSGKISYEEFLDWLDEDTWAEWVDGEIVMMSPVGDVHQDLGGWLLALLRFYAEGRDLGVIRYEPFQMKTGPDLPGRSPDILFVANAHRSRLKKALLEGPADLVVEIVSPDSGSRTTAARRCPRGDKFYEYEAGGVSEYWLLDQPRKQAEFFQRGEDGLYRPAPISDGIFRSAVLPGLWLRVEWLWQDPLPSLMSVLKEWGLV